MTQKMKPEYHARRAKELKEDPTLLLAFEQIHKEAVEELIGVLPSPENMTMIAALQQRAIIASQMPMYLERFVLAFGEPEEESDLPH